MKEEIINRIKEERISLGISQNEFAKKLGVSRSVVAKWEQGRTFPSLNQIKNVCEVLKINISSLLNDHEIKYIIEDNYEYELKKKTLYLSLALIFEIITIVIILIVHQRFY